MLSNVHKNQHKLRPINKQVPQFLSRTFVDAIKFAVWLSNLIFFQCPKQNTVPRKSKIYTLYQNAIILMIWFSNADLADSICIDLDGVSKGAVFNSGWEIWAQSWLAQLISENAGQIAGSKTSAHSDLETIHWFVVFLRSVKFPCRCYINKNVWSIKGKTGQLYTQNNQNG